MNKKNYIKKLKEIKDSNKNNKDKNNKKTKIYFEKILKIFNNKKFYLVLLFIVLSLSILFLMLEINHYSKIISNQKNYIYPGYLTNKHTNSVFDNPIQNNNNKKRNMENK